MTDIPLEDRRYRILDGNENCIGDVGCDSSYFLTGILHEGKPVKELAFNESCIMDFRASGTTGRYKVLRVV